MKTAGRNVNPVAIHRLGVSSNWRNVREAVLSYGIEYAAGADPAWPLVLASRGIPYRLQHRSSGSALYVPVFLEQLAASEIAKSVQENKPAPAPPVTFPALRTGSATFWLLLCVIIWHGIRMHWWPQLSASLPAAMSNLSADQWAEAGRVEGLRILAGGEWYRVVTALTLHADSRHLFGNIVSGGIFLGLLSSRTGSGIAWLMALIAGISGNVCSVLFSGYYYASLGFSTAVFGAVGALCGTTLAFGGHRSTIKAVTVVAAGLGLLAMLGMEGERTDITAHIFGLICGFVVGQLGGRLLYIDRLYGTEWQARLNKPCGLLAAIIVMAGWWVALA
ncbi:rhomboid family intramembrane serine protease [Oleidesulfovibrio sp.]|uniref:rhomboid family intramembrane serine protease n=1 Tax=Oleidesulfovibrio sp. TaxID=2909707 RepID=UPI003A89BBDD